MHLLSNKGRIEWTGGGSFFNLTASTYIVGKIATNYATYTHVTGSVHIDSPLGSNKQTSFAGTEDLLNSDTAIKIWKYLSGTELYLGRGATVGEWEWKNRSSVFKREITNIILELKEKEGRFFRGGSNTDWREVEKLAREWYFRVIKIRPHLYQEVSVRRIEKNVAGIYEDLTRSPKKTVSLSHVWSSVEGAIYDDAYHVVKETMYERWRNKNSESAVELEYEVLKRGGLILGISRSYIVVYYPNYQSRIMNKLIGKEESL